MGDGENTFVSEDLRRPDPTLGFGRIRRKVDYCQICQRSRATDVKQPPRPVHRSLFPLANVLLIPLGEWFDAEILIVRELHMGALVIVQNDKHSLKLRA